MYGRERIFFLNFWSGVFYLYHIQQLQKQFSLLFTGYEKSMTKKMRMENNKLYCVMSSDWYATVFLTKRIKKYTRTPIHTQYQLRIALYHVPTKIRHKKRHIHRKGTALGNGKYRYTIITWNIPIGTMVVKIYDADALVQIAKRKSKIQRTPLTLLFWHKFLCFSICANTIISELLTFFASPLVVVVFTMIRKSLNNDSYCW